uniref:Uncharacterized protein n=1 Tax=Anopheles stephensi TaxID=30069 RepID=A0A182Y7E1_ANOST
MLSPLSPSNLFRSLLIFAGLSLQYSLLQTVVEACQKKRHCKFLASPKTFGGDPCPGQRKFVEVAYKCRPYEFRSKIACENDVIQLICNPYSRIAIYSANYGRTEYESLQCAQPQGVKEESKYPAPASNRRSLTLLPRKVLKDRFEAAPEPDEPLQSDLEQDQDELYDEDQFFRESDAAPPGPAPKLQGGPTNGRVSDVPVYVGTSSSTPAVPPRSIHDIMDDSDFSFGENQEKFYLYLIVAVTVAILLCVSIVIGRLVMQRRRTAKDGDDKFQTSNTGETTLPNGFTDDISEIDADIDLQTPLPVPSVSRSDSNQTCLPFARSLHAFSLPACGFLFHDCHPSNGRARTDCVASHQSYGPYTPSPGPYGNLGPSNISHTSTTMLVPPCSMGAAIMSTSQPPGYLSGPINIMPSQLGSSIGAIRTPLAAMTTLPRPHQGSQQQQQQLPPGFLGGSVIGTQTLRRLSSDHDGNTPRSLSRGATNAQYYYG